MNAAARGGAGIVFGALTLGMTVGALSEDLPKGYQQILPRGRIASIDTPHFVPAAKAKIPGDAWVLGVVVDGEARAYSLNLLNEHEIVNDRAGSTSFAAVW